MSRSSATVPCLLCERELPPDVTERCLTDCAHEFCLRCICRELAERKNRCPACHAHVKQLHQLTETTASDAPAPASIKFCNATYVLNVSIWSIDDPARKLASLFHLEHARLIHRGKMLKKGDVWPGTTVQLFGTKKGSARGSNALAAGYTSWVDKAWLQRAQQIICCPLTVVFAFFQSLFGFDGTDARGQRGYTRVATAEPATTTSSFHEPGRVSRPPDHSESA
uniref:RING-type domain-containing protein n=1 Tax=Globisporangium ultimum (strain ATCC 200006 / CBS 805.95 / DAOM BR144) TaxID=431595 RepID=K3WMN1_GLOUD